jgi:GNAT superfamily N-acetyltransferase
MLRASGGASDETQSPPGISGPYQPECRGNRLRRRGTCRRGAPRSRSGACPILQDCFDETPQEEIESDLREGFTWLIAEDESGAQIAACVCVHERRPRLPAGMGWIGQLAVDPVLRRQRLGTSLMNAAEKRLREHGCKGVVIGVLTFKAPHLLPFYEPQGYLDTTHRGRPDSPRKEGCNRDTDLIIMFKAFELSS